VRRLAAGIALTLIVSGCSAGPEASTTESPPASGTTAGSARPSATRGTCNPFEDGGPCLGKLGAGTYTTQVFTPSITYTVTDGWGNWEDLLGNFLLLPPGETLEGVNGDARDFIGIYHGVAAMAADCEEVPEPGVGSSAQAMADWFGSHPGLVVTQLQPIEIGGLNGLVLDLNLAPDWTGTCPFAQAGEPLVPLIIGTGPAGLGHVLNASFTTRLYLLDLAGGNIVIEVVDHPGDEQGLGDYATVVDDIKFGTQS
jgi:hypothetical protein